MFAKQKAEENYFKIKTLKILNVDGDCGS